MSTATPSPPSPIHPSVYLESRLRLLAKVARDHAQWEHQFSVLGRDDFFAQWTDGHGQTRLYGVTTSFLDAHRQVLTSLIADLDRLGTDYRALAGRIVAEEMRAIALLDPFPDDFAQHAEEEIV